MGLMPQICATMAMAASGNGSSDSPLWAKGPIHTSLGQRPRSYAIHGLSANGAAYEWQTGNINNMREVFGRYTRYMVQFQWFKALHAPLQNDLCPLHCLILST
jgi:hypothetical protein